VYAPLNCCRGRGMRGSMPLTRTPWDPQVSQRPLTSVNPTRSHDLQSLLE
jgi:hypothetical protein